MSRKAKRHRNAGAIYKLDGQRNFGPAIAGPQRIEIKGAVGGPLQNARCDLTER